MILTNKGPVIRWSISPGVYLARFSCIECNACFSSSNFDRRNPGQTTNTWLSERRKRRIQEWMSMGVVNGCRFEQDLRDLSIIERLIVIDSDDDPPSWSVYMMQTWRGKNHTVQSINRLYSINPLQAIVTPTLEWSIVFARAKRTRVLKLDQKHASIWVDIILMMDSIFVPRGLIISCTHHIWTDKHLHSTNSVFPKLSRKA